MFLVFLMSFLMFFFIVFDKTLVNLAKSATSYLFFSTFIERNYYDDFTKLIRKIEEQSSKIAELFCEINGTGLCRIKSILEINRHGSLLTDQDNQ